MKISITFVKGKTKNIYCNMNIQVENVSKRKKKALSIKAYVANLSVVMGLILTSMD